MSSTPPNHKESSDTIWIAGAAIITVGGLGFALSSGGDNKGSHHESSHASVHNPASKKKEEPDAPKGNGGKMNAKSDETEADSTEAQESIKRAVKSDEPSTAKSEEKKSAGSSRGEDDDYVKVSPDDVKGSLAQAEKADVPAVAKPEEEKAGRSK